jgi:hypothetical protein
MLSQLVSFIIIRSWCCVSQTQTQLAGNLQGQVYAHKQQLCFGLIGYALCGGGTGGTSK